MISGAAVVVERLAVGMAKRGHQILVIAASDDGNAYSQDHPNIRILRLQSVANPKRAEQRFVTWPTKELTTEVRDFGPDIIHIHDVLNLGVYGLMVGRASGIPVIATIHQLPWFISAYLPDVPGLKMLTESSLWRYSRWLDKQCQQMIVPTPTIANTIERCGHFKTIPISNGINLEQFSPYPSETGEKERLISKYHLDPTKPIVLHVGRLDADKNVEALIRAVADVLVKTDSQFLIVGDGEKKKSLEKLAAQLGIDDLIHFPGFINPKGDLPGIYRLGTVFTTASEIETQGLVLLEAMASGLPVVAVRATCIHELVKDSVNGYLIPPGSANQLAAKIEALATNPTKAKQMGIASMKIAQAHDSHFSLNQHENLYISTIQEFIQVKDQRIPAINIRQPFFQLFKKIQ
jgi:glycosyltransferase involved in cell wall biosynthesis